LINKSKDKNPSALKVKDGIAQPPAFNPDAVVQHSKRRQTHLAAVDYIKGIRGNDRALLSKAITLVESNLPHDFPLAQELIEGCYPYAGDSLRIGITGVPGVGKSTFIEALGKHLTANGHKLAILAVDPSSQKTKGSILGDKTRMPELASDENAFIRPSPSAGTLGGVARKTRETIVLFEAAGYDIILVETVGVGQSEMVVHSMVDFFLLLMIAGAGDELQGIKRGIMEMADAIIINKADGDNYRKALLAKKEYENALHLFPPADSGWTPRVDVCSALTGEGIQQLWDLILDYMSFTKKTGYFRKHRQEQEKQILMEAIGENLRNHFLQDQRIRELLPGIEKDMIAKKISSYAAAQQLISHYLANKPSI
jgi:LAO/AO transport system kinase